MNQTMELKPQVNSEPLLINKTWLIIPMFLPGVLGLINIITCLSLLYIFTGNHLSSMDVGVSMVVVVAGVMFTGIYLLIGLCGLVTIVYRYLVLKTFKLFMAGDHLVVQSGILSKSERTIPYYVIQNIILSRGLTDYFLELTSIQIENASNSGMVYSVPGKSSVAFGNMVSIPCLSADVALDIRNQLLDKLRVINQLVPGRGI